jgi:WD40 repeat protein
MRLLQPVTAILLLMLASCGSPGPAPVRDGPGLVATLAADWPTSGAPARQLAFSHDGRLLATSDTSGLITLGETRTWRPIAELHHPGGATAVAFGRDDKVLFSAGYDGKVRLWDLGSRRPVGVFQGPSKPVWTVDVSPDGARVAAGSEDAAIYVWSLDRAGAPKVLRGHQGNVWEVRFSPDGKQLASGSFDKTARLWNVATGKVLRTLSGHSQAVVGLAFSPDGKILATCGDDSTIRFWRLADGEATRTIPAGNHTYKLAFSRDGRWLVSGGRAFGGLGTLWHQLTDGGGAAAPVHIWRTADGALVAALSARDDTPNVDFSPDGKWLAASGEDHRIRLWRLREVRTRS